MHITTIPETQCIGDSLETINSNFSNLNNAAISLSATKVSKAGDTMTGPLTLPNSDPSLNNHATRKLYVDQRDSLQLSLSGGTVTGPVFLAGYTNGLPTQDLHAATKKYVDNRIPEAADITGKVDRAGDALTGFLTLHAPPSADMHASTKQYVDSHPGAAKAWVNFNGTASVTIRSSYGISGINRHGSGDYTITFTSGLMPDANYCIIGSSNSTSQGTAFHVQSQTTASCRINIRNTDSTPSLTDSAIINVAFFR
jgi:hypothetical protein